MASDYALIAADNQRKYGTHVGQYARTLLVDKYSDRTHFIYELLQNAEDARASSVRFYLRRDRLEVVHNGRPFTEADVIGVCGIVESTKSTNEMTIGKFGIGFKSVYAYTSTPQIHSGDEHFQIHDYVLPEAVDLRRVADSETLFLFPFDHTEVDASAAFRDIGMRLQELGSRILLFLHHVDAIQWEVEDGPSGTYLRDNKTRDGLQHVTVLGQDTDHDTEESWLVFDKVIVLDEQPLTVEIAFLLERDEVSKDVRVVPVDRSAVVVFFPTEKDTRLGFLIQGPYHTTPARDNIFDADRRNTALIEATCTLVVEALSLLRDHGLLTVSCLEALPIIPAAFPPGSMFRPIYDAVADALSAELLLPTSDGTFISGSQASIARSTAVRNVVSPAQLQSLLRADHPMHWLTSEISRDRTPELRAYLLGEIHVSEITPEDFARLITERFMQEQDDEWVIHLYRFLLTQDALWRGAEMPRHTPLRGPILDRPIIRLQDGRHVCPFTDDNQPSAYLSNVVDTTIPIVKLSISAVDGARTFLLKLGYTEPDIVVDVKERILPLYRGADAIQFDFDEQCSHIEAIVRALATCSGSRRADLVTAVRSTPFLHAQDVQKRQLRLKRPGDLYYRSPALELYFEGNQSVWFLGEQYVAFQTVLEELGVSRVVRVQARQRDRSGYVQIASLHGDHSRGLDGFDPDCHVDGLDRALVHPTVERSEFIWNEIVRPNVQRVSGVVESATLKSYANASRDEQMSRMGAILQNSTWLPDTSGEMRRPHAVSLEDLPIGFVRDDTLADKLGMRSKAITSLAQEVGLEPDVLSFILANPDQIRGLMNTSSQQRLLDDDTDEESVATKSLDYEGELEAAFSRVGRIDLENDLIDVGVVADPARRRAAVAEQIAREHREAPAREKMFVRVTSKKWQAKNSEVREFLVQQYHGKCQICDQTFLKRNGDPFFEGLYLVSRIAAPWLDRSGNVLCLCPTCCAKFMHGSVDASDVVEQIDRQRLMQEGGVGELVLRVVLCGRDAHIRFTERHMLDLQEIIRGTRSGTQ